MPRKVLKKGSPEAKRFMARLRAMRGKKSRKKKRRRTTRKRKKPRRRTTIARRRRRRRRQSRGPKLPIALLGGLSGGLIAAAYLKNPMRDPAGFAGQVVANYTGYNPARGVFDPGALGLGLMPLLAGALVHKGVGSMLGVNRMLGRYKVPLIRL